MTEEKVVISNVSSENELLASSLETVAIKAQEPIPEGLTQVLIHN